MEPTQKEQEVQKTLEKFGTVSLIILIIFLFFFFKNCLGLQHKVKETNTMNSALADSIKTWRNKEGNFVANITLLRNENADYFTKWTTSDSTVIQLQKLVESYKRKLAHGGSATVITTDAGIHLTEPTQVIKDTLQPYNPIYKSNFNIYGTGKESNIKWVWGETTATKDSTTIGMRFHEEIDVVIGQEKTGFLGLGKPRPFAEVTLHNPFNKVSTLRSYSNSPLPVKHFSIGPTVMYGIGSDFKFGTFIGIGGTYNILRF